VVRRGTAYGQVTAQGFHIPSGGKTGTTNDYKDVWYIGFTRDLVAGVWMGFDEPARIMGNAQGGRLAAPVWTAMMREVYARRRSSGDWPVPDGLVLEQIDKLTGFRATPFCPIESVGLEYFVAGTEPREFCPLHGGGRIKNTTHQP
jgi:membrane carboxypeptidase/penicillin-binding protein